MFLSSMALALAMKTKKTQLCNKIQKTDRSEWALLFNQYEGNET